MCFMAAIFCDPTIHRGYELKVVKCPLVIIALAFWTVYIVPALPSFLIKLNTNWLRKEIEEILPSPSWTDSFFINKSDSYYGSLLLHVTIFSNMALL